MKFFKPREMQYMFSNDSLTLWGAPTTLHKIQRALLKEPVEIKFHEGRATILIYLFDGIAMSTRIDNKLTFEGFSQGSLEIMIRMSRRLKGG